MMITALACALMFSIRAGADAPGATTQAEVAHLLSYLESSGCDFYRNGTWHSAKEARAHLERKYTYLVNRSMVSSAEEFIERAATSSSMSGQPYLVRCAAGQSVPSGVWLRAELERFRSSRKGPAR
jgi:hypothetical protein